MCIKKENISTEVMPKVSIINHGGITKKLPKKNLYLKPVLSTVVKQENFLNFQRNKNVVNVNDILKNFGAAEKEPIEDRRTEAAGNVRTGTKAFISIMQHSLACSSCDDIKCRKMKMVMSHYIQCTKLKAGLDCGLCRQLLRVVAEHALYLCPHRIGGPKFPCPVPLCDVMRASAALQKKKV